jgi:uncharacterized protein YbjT (DUF2867 family)
MKKTAVVAGSTGLVGEQLVKCLIQSKEYEAVTALVRKGSSKIYEGAFTIEVDFDRLSDYTEELKADVVFCCLGTTIKKAGTKSGFQTVDFTFPLELAKIAAINGSSQFNIITASGANSKSLIFYNRVKGDIENAITKLGIPNINIFRPSLLLGERVEKRRGEVIGARIAKILNPLMVGRLKKFRAIQAAEVASAMINVSLMEQDGVRIFESDVIHVLGLNTEK